MKILRHRKFSLIGALENMDVFHKKYNLRQIQILPLSLTFLAFHWSNFVLQICAKNIKLYYLARYLRYISYLFYWFCSICFCMCFQSPSLLAIHSINLSHQIFPFSYSHVLYNVLVINRSYIQWRPPKMILSCDVLMILVSVSTLLCCSHDDKMVKWWISQNISVLSSDT